jgi:beta-phosphoglucomutase-like phosphatase (HAD superfamily)
MTSTAAAGLQHADFVELEATDDGLFRAGQGGVSRVCAPRDRKVAFVVFEDGRVLCHVRSAMGYPAYYPLQAAHFEGPAEAVLMDLDGTSVHSESFWIWVIEQTTARLLQNPRFQLEEADTPHVSGHSVSEHLQYCIQKYAPGASVEDARRHYFDITHHELAEIVAGRGKADAFTPAPGLKEFLLEIKGRGIRIGLVTSGLHEKAWPEILSAFRTLKMGDPLEFYDAIITAGFALRHGQAGTLGELAPKPHPWLYAETARVGLGIAPERRHRVIGFEDSSAGVVSIRLAGFAACGVAGGNIEAAGVAPLVMRTFETLTDALPLVLGK